ncbi:hypothetical protein SteCoe_9722 [Stentor coeruleus]|uniref:Rhodanese domain-containing protein n=1 Tax=Stentor coeruleus TaxID=5963 RepID=A0A1R2CH90_9CILI|nr:hypothetical protein SteCoe_9722 [Stentor coeruleus]
MCFINVKELKSLRTKTLLFFTQGPYFGKVLLNSHIIEYPLELSIFIRELRKLDITDFPVICYDNDNLKIASLAFWIFESLGYSVYLLYGNIMTFLDLGEKLQDTSKGDLPQSQLLMEIDINKLPNVKTYDSVVLDLNQPLYQAIGSDFNHQTVKKYLHDNNIPEDFDGFTLSGQYAGLIGALLKYLGNNSNKIFLGEWKDIDFNRRVSSRPETFYSAVGSVYYDAEDALIDEEPQKNEEGNTETKNPETLGLTITNESMIEEDNIKTKNSETLGSTITKENIIQDKTVNPYSSPLMISKSSTQPGKNDDDFQGYHCKCQVI